MTRRRSSRRRLSNPQMQPTIYQFVVGGAMLANAILGHFLFRAAHLVRPTALASL